MGKYSATSDVKCAETVSQPLLSVGFASDTLPEVQKPSLVVDSRTGVSTRYVRSKEPLETPSGKEHSQWYALRTTYGREKRACDYLAGKNIEVFYPTLKRIKLVGGKRVTIEESRIPNLFFARGTEEEISSFVFDNVNLPFLRFYYRHTHVGNKRIKMPLVVPEKQMNSLKRICSVDSDDIITSTDEITKFREGQKVRVNEGKFKGVVGIVARYHGQQRVGVIIDGLLTVCTAYVPSAFLEIVNKDIQKQ